MTGNQLSQCPQAQSRMDKKCLSTHTVALTEFASIHISGKRWTFVFIAIVFASLLLETIYLIFEMSPSYSRVGSYTPSSLYYNLLEIRMLWLIWNPFSYTCLIVLF